MKILEKAIMRIYASVTGDLFHYGHVAFFKSARAFGISLTVGICSNADVSVRSGYTCFL